MGGTIKSRTMASDLDLSCVRSVKAFTGVDREGRTLVTADVLSQRFVAWKLKLRTVILLARWPGPKVALFTVFNHTARAVAESEGVIRKIREAGKGLKNAKVGCDKWDNSISRCSCVAFLPVCVTIRGLLVGIDCPPSCST